MDLNPQERVSKIVDVEIQQLFKDYASVIMGQGGIAIEMNLHYCGDDVLNIQQEHIFVTKPNY